MKGLESISNINRDMLYPLFYNSVGLIHLNRIQSQEIVKRYGKDISGIFLNNRKNKNAIPVMVCAKNEEVHLPRLLYGLSKQTHPVTPLIVDNGSTDGTVQIAKNLGCEIISENTPGLIFALKKGFGYFSEKKQKSSILLTDADSIPVTTWAEELLRLSRKQIDLSGGQLFGPVFYFGRGILGLIKTLQFSYLKDVKYYRNNFVKARGPNSIIKPDSENLILESLTNNMSELVITGTDELVKDTIKNSGGKVDRTWNSKAMVFSQYDRPVHFKTLIRSFFGVDISRDQYSDWYSERPDGIKYIPSKN